MTQRIAYVEAVFGADITGFRRGTAQVRRDLGVLSDQVNGLSNIGRKMTLMLTAPLVAAGTAAVKFAMDFGEAMTNVRSILTDMSDKDFAELTDQTLKWGSSIRSGPQAAAEALYTVVSAGYTNIEDAMMVAHEATAMAEAGLADLTGSAEALASAVLTYGVDTEEGIGHMSDVITRAVQVGVGSMDEFSTASSTLAATAYALGVSYDEAMGSVAYFTQRGKDARTAATELNMAMTAMYKPTEDMKNAMHQLGVGSAKELIEKFGGLQEAIFALGSTVDYSQEGLGAMFGRVQAMRAVTLLTSDITGASSAMEEFYADIEGATDAARAVQLTSLAAQFDTLKSAVQGAAIAIGDDLGKILEPVISGLRDMFIAVLNLPPEILTLGTAFGVAVAAAGPLLWLLGNIASPVSVLIGLASALGIAFVTNFEGIKDTVSIAVESVTGGLGPLKDALTEFFDILFGPTPNADNKDLLPQVDTQQTWDFSITEGASTGWDVWASRGEEWASVTWDAFSEAFNAATDEGVYQIGDHFSLALGDAISSSAPRAMDNQRSIFDVRVDPEDYSIGGRISRAITDAWPKISDAFDTLRTNVSVWFTETFLPEFDNWGGDILSRLAASLSVRNMGEEKGQTPLYESIHNLLSGGIEDGVNSITGIVQENLPGISSGLNSLIKAIGGWIRETGLPTLSRTVGYLFGTIASMAVQGISQALSGGGEAVSGISDFWNEAIATPFSEGFQEAKDDRGIKGGIEELFTNLAGLFLTVGVPIFGLQLLGGAFGGKVAGLIVSAITLPFTAAGKFVLAPLATALWNQLKSSFAASAAAKAAGTAAATAVTDNIAAGLTGPASSVAIHGLSVALGSVIQAAVLAIPFAIVGALIIESIRGAILDQIENPDTRKATETMGNYGTGGSYEGSTGTFGGGGIDVMQLRQPDAWQSFLQQNGLAPENPPAIELSSPMVSYDAGQTFAEGMIEGATVTTEAQGDQMFTPLVNAANENATTAFGEGSILRTSVQGSMDQISSLSTTGVTNMSTFSEGAVLALTPLHDQLSEMGDVLAIMQELGVPLHGSVWQGSGIDTLTGKAGGGAVNANQAYVVGEHGAELLTMGNRSGSIIPNEALGSAGGAGGSVSYNDVSIAAQMDIDYLLDELERRGVYLRR